MISHIFQLQAYIILQNLLYNTINSIFRFFFLNFELF